MITSFNGPLITAQEFALEVARGHVAGAQPFGSYGEILMTGPIANRIIWPDGAYNYPPFATGAAWEILSSDPADTLAGAGARKVEVHFIGTDLVETSRVINMNGTAPVTTDENGQPLPNAKFFQCTHIHQSGTFGGGAVGTITIRPAGGGVTYALILAGDLRCASSARMVPKGKRAVVVGLVASSVSGTAATGAIIRAVATQLDTHQYTDKGLFIPFGSTGMQDGAVPYVLPVPAVFKEGTIVALTATIPDNKTARISGAHFGWIEDAA